MGLLDLLMGNDSENLIKKIERAQQIKKEVFELIEEGRQLKEEIMKIVDNDSSSGIVKQALGELFGSK